MHARLSHDVQSVSIEREREKLASRCTVARNLSRYIFIFLMRNFLFLLLLSSSAAVLFFHFIIIYIYLSQLHFARQSDYILLYLVAFESLYYTQWALSLSLVCWCSFASFYSRRPNLAWIILRHYVCARLCCGPRASERFLAGAFGDPEELMLLGRKKGRALQNEVKLPFALL